MPSEQQKTTEPVNPYDFQSLAQQKDYSPAVIPSEANQRIARAPSKLRYILCSFCLLIGTMSMVLGAAFTLNRWPPASYDLHNLGGYILYFGLGSCLLLSAYAFLSQRTVLAITALISAVLIPAALFTLLGVN